ncbi:MAG: glycosyltransferase family 4 protein [Gemmatimonadota bacterium]
MNQSRRRPGCAITWVSEAYEAGGRHVVGRQSAGAGFLDAYIRYAGQSGFCCVAPTQAAFEEFRGRVARVDADAGAAVRWIQAADFEALGSVGCLFQPGPMLGDSAWIRRRGPEHGYSLCGVTHSVATERAMRGIRDYITAPTQPWDALICTSESARRATLRIIDSWRGYLQRRGFTTPDPVLELPVIPLGVDVASFSPTAERRQQGRELRRELGIAADDVAILYFGRVTVQSKAHPTPMFRALELAQRGSIDRNLHFIICGQFGDPVTARELAEVRSRFAPSIVTHLVDGNDARRSAATWHAADIFFSLSDNVQESFGLTLLEAQAAGLAVVASDWNGYRETVIHGRTGFLAPTLAPPPGSGIAIADELAAGALDQESVLALTAQSVAVDIDAAAAAIAQLALDAERREWMGRESQAHVAAFDWRHIIGRYQDLWTELESRRGTDKAVGPRRRECETVHPDYADPFWIFEGHPSRTLKGSDSIEIAEIDAVQKLQSLEANAVHMFAGGVLIDASSLQRLVGLLAGGARLTVAEAVEWAEAPSDRVHRSLTWLAKFGVVRIGDQ